MVASLDRVLGPEDGETCEGDLGEGGIAADELAQAFTHTRLGKAPGSDGLPYEFCRTLWGVYSGTAAG